jgi:hypothetical protein
MLMASTHSVGHGLPQPSLIHYLLRWHSSRLGGLWECDHHHLTWILAHWMWVELMLTMGYSKKRVPRRDLQGGSGMCRVVSTCFRPTQCRASPSGLGASGGVSTGTRLMTTWSHSAHAWTPCSALHGLAKLSYTSRLEKAVDTYTTVAPLLLLLASHHTQIDGLVCT